MDLGRQCTIIESLKYATTGEKPPNTQNGAFIHDPRLCGEKEMLAQVKLAFLDPSGAKLVVSRNTSVTLQKGKKPGEKTLDLSLMRHANGERICLSKRQNELDVMVPQYLGVSRAVLENVIFCHQDDSLWPMSQPAVLKKKFDEIFEALKYTRAIANIKALRKNYMEEVKKLQVTESSCKVNKDRADRCAKRSSEISEEIEVLRSEIKDFEKLTEEATTKNKQAWDRSAQFSHVVEALKANTDRHKWKHEQMISQKQELKVRPESDDWLRNELDQSEERVRAREDQQQQKTDNYEQLRQTADGARGRLDRKQNELGRHENAQLTHEQEIEGRKNLVKDSARRHNIRGYDIDLDDMQINEYMDKIGKLCKDQSSNVERARRETEKEMQKVQAVLSSLGERKSGLSEGKSSTKQQSSINDKKIASFQAELDKLEIDEGAKALSECKVRDIDKSLQQARSEYEQSQWDGRIHSAKTESRITEEEFEHIDQEFVESTKRSKDLARLEHLRKELDNRRRTLETLTGAHAERLRNVIGSNWEVATLERDFHIVLDRRSKELKECEDRRASSSRNLEQTDFKLSSSKKALREAKAEVQECRKSITQVMEEVTKEEQHEPDTYPSFVEQLQKDRDTMEADVNNFSNLQKFWNKSIKTAKNQGRCELCERGFHGEPEKSAFVRKMEAMIADRVKGGLQDSKNDLANLEDDLRKARAVSAKFNTWQRLSSSELPRLQSDVQDLEQMKATQIRKGEDDDREVEEQEGRKKTVESLSKPTAAMANLHNETIHFSRQIEELSVMQNNAGHSRTIDEIQQQRESLAGLSRSRRNVVDKLTAQQHQAQEQISKQELSLSNAKNELNAATHELEKKLELDQRLEELRNTNREHREHMRLLDSQIDELSPQVSAQETKLKDIKQRGLKREQDLQQEAGRLSDSVRGLNSADQKIRAYQDDGGSSRLDRCRREILNLQQEIDGLEKEKKQVIVEINGIKEELRNQQETRRTISDNLSYRKITRELEEIEKEIERLREQNAEQDLEHYQKQSRYWEKQYYKHKMDLTSKLATMTAKDNELIELLKEWETDYKNAASEYKEAHIKVEASKASPAEDLGRYGSALDKAIMQYHTLKMEEINRIAEELWKRTYQGTDVDSILIRSDNETARGNRTYNYRVCMIKQDAEMDMRGRCSAGQRVLASIIIRLALAECFGVRCGLIALDEPTTNLDRDNIRALAESLHDIIRARQQQSNFQLIVITHDEEFLRHMKCADFCDTYYRVSRTDRQKSRIERQSIADVM
ncbi:MAG: hypothetical protein Q9174_000514 [Haloplaca sp. 1 TL-2023]